MFYKCIEVYLHSPYALEFTLKELENFYRKYTHTTINCKIKIQRYAICFQEISYKHITVFHKIILFPKKLWPTHSNCHMRRKHTATEITIFLNSTMLNTVHRNDLFNQTTLSKCGRVLRRKGVLTCYLNGTMREGGRRSGADLRHRCPTCIQGKCSLHAACCTFLSSPQANERCFWFQGTTNFYNTWYFPFAVTNRFTWKKLGHTACAYVNRYFLFTDCRLHRE